MIAVEQWLVWRKAAVEQISDAADDQAKLFIIRATASAASLDEICVFMSVSCQAVMKMSFPLMEQLPCQTLMFVKSLFLKTIFSCIGRHILPADSVRGHGGRTLDRIGRNALLNGIGCCKHLTMSAAGDEAR